MKKVLYYFGRLLQLIALVTMPFAIWIGHLGHNERGAIIIFIGSLIIFLIGWVISCIRTFYES